jgi:hypothetical protein
MYDARAAPMPLYVAALCAYSSTIINLVHQLLCIARSGDIFSCTEGAMADSGSGQAGARSSKRSAKKPRARREATQNPLIGGLIGLFQRHAIHRKASGNRKGSYLGRTLRSTTPLFAPGTKLCTQRRRETCGQHLALLSPGQGGRNATEPGPCFCWCLQTNSAVGEFVKNS